jgi:hypothetical protein
LRSSQDLEEVADIFAEQDEAFERYSEIQNDKRLTEAERRDLLRIQGDKIKSVTDRTNIRLDLKPTPGLEPGTPSLRVTESRHSLSRAVVPGRAVCGDTTTRDDPERRRA